MPNPIDASQNDGSHVKRAIHVTYVLAGSAEKVWRTLTEPDLLEQWLFPNDIVPEVGRQFAFRTTPGPGFDGTIKCEVIAVSHGRHLVYTWQRGPVDTIVNFTLDAPTTDSTRLTLLQTGFGPQDGAIFDLLEGGWRDRSSGLLEKLVASL